MTKKKLMTYLALVGVCLVLIVVIESSAHFIRVILGRDSVGWVFAGKPPELSDPCQVMRTHPLYSHTHAHNNECEIRDGYAVGPFVHYDEEYDGQEVLVTLGGSTTDGFFSHVSDGETWPLQLNRQLVDTKIRVINGGTGGYDSARELLKLVVDVGNLPYDIRYVVSLNGINDIGGHGGSDALREQLPFFSARMLASFNDQKLTRQDTVNPLARFFPATKSLLLAALRRVGPAEADVASLGLNEDARNAILLKDTKKFSPEGRWFYNITLMHAVSAAIGAEYHVFLQPTMGLRGPQSEAPQGTDDFALLQQVLSSDVEDPSLGYIRRLNDFYDGARKLCEGVDYCHDISNMVPPTGDVYHDPRHHNAKGNARISQLIYEYLELR